MRAWPSGDKRRLIGVLALLLLLGFAATTLVSYQVSKSSVRETIVSSELPLTSDNLYSEIQKDLIRPILISSMMASDTFVRDWVLSGERDPEPMTRYLREVKDRYGAFTSFFVSERTRTYYQTGGVLKRVQEDEPRDAWYFRVRAMPAPYEINLDPDLANRDALTIFINYKVVDYDGQFIGAIGVGLTVDAVRGLITDYQQRFKRSIYFVDRKGRVALFGNDQHPAGSDIRAMPGVRDVAERILAEGAGTFQYQAGRNTHFLNVRFIPELGWYLLVDGDEDAALSRIRGTLYVNLAICLVISAVVLLATSLTINRYQGRLEELAVTDELTGLANRRAFDLLIPQALGESRRAGEPLLAMMIDLDHFKSVNDGHGHAAGDALLRRVARVMQETLRASDLLFRWGGEEFLVVLKRTDLAQGRQLAERVRAAIEAVSVPWDEAQLGVTASVGLALLGEGEPVDEVIRRADEALYEAKRQGRNRVV